jgi:hypothetical protein
MSLRRIGTGVVCIAIAVSLTACGSSPPPPVEHPVFSTPYLRKASILAVFRAHGILLQKTFGDNLQTAYDGISATELGVHVVGLIVYPRETQRGLAPGGGPGDPITVANVEIWIVPGLSRQPLASARAAIEALTTDCACTSPSFALLNGLVTITSGDWNNKPWVLKAGDIADGQYCIELTGPAGPGLLPTGCGSIHPPYPSVHVPQNIGAVVQNIRVNVPRAVFGPVISTARSVQITFTNGTHVTVPTIAPPETLNSGIRFYIARRPCHAMFTEIIALDSDDRVVATESGPASPLARREFAQETC